ncbi:endonuclease/exonuclease/phosphatase family protein [Cognatishimia sp. MH4019]|uniref:endonuclease/exonuclease/phosphatase family protein n=1 Tax=Cognatishimia sp. MH4019 TaxID=2854030 RepID=UPI001CD4BE8A|nr:endonuclease/exonuclease/phosphatase family protein [Cognatishimia sp. MH4019]
MSDPRTALSCISWNIHRGRDEDGAVDPARTVTVLCDEVCSAETELLILQEADEECPPHRGFLNIQRIEAETGLRYIHTETHSRWGQDSHGFLGVVCFVHPSIKVEAIRVLDLPGHCHRGAVLLDLVKDGHFLRAIGTHLSLSQALRIVQMRTLGQHLFRLPNLPAILCGDLNEWRPWGGLALSRRVLGADFQGPAPRTFPVRRPLLPLDRFLSAGGAHIEKTMVLDGPGIRMASDHRPLAARVTFDVAR